MNMKYISVCVFMIYSLNFTFGQNEFSIIASLNLNDAFHYKIYGHESRSIKAGEVPTFGYSVGLSNKFKLGNVLT